MPDSRHRQYTKGSHFTSGHIDTDKCSRRDQTRVPALHYDCAQYSRLPRSRTMVQCYIMYARVSGITGSHVLQHRTVRCTISFKAIVLCRLCSTAMDGWDGSRPINRALNKRQVMEQKHGPCQRGK
ncbi:hypothetical protein FOZG_11381 [Fusarium oxysporum Fo47]|uniref:Uncharacterized protein n=1 Tax=Fusarium oxysporum Fo47 TaxID=660027 RepID=W9K1V0_FUSOX|nr:hypothetical protein FOZG_11381 [Fusarium oxysporum Fo47]EWZ35431.1 hypothetical protein FOZG_11381 [Fusarium oxysporum Fo47]EWZ35432.1 hypothetical protein FOZG_11381 [Fusarium oxysporum Fo47]EWZ35433.1 hypothetical protein FOZG_11381 [Fusarium oxysporum Fo47]EWZ35434.1 hypothetical protein FOZG_11381 [Fusarium oxysporum Fo47]